MLEQVHFDEARQSQLTAIELLLSVGYRYVSSEEALKERGGDASNFILADIAAKKLMEINNYEVAGNEYKFSEKDVRDAIDELEHVQYEGLIDTAQKIYNIIMPTSGGKTIKVHASGKTVSKNFRFIDFENPKNNIFHVTAEFVVSGKQTIRPDIVCFVNGIPFAVIENKKGSVGAVEAINQMNRNQGPEFCPKFFVYTQLLVGTNGKELQYGTTGTPNKFYAVWKEKGVSLEEMNKRVSKLIAKKIDAEVYTKILEDLNGPTTGHKQKLDRLVTEQDRGVLSLFEPARLLDLVKNHILFDAGVKKMSRYQQYFAIQKMIKLLKEEEVSDQGIARRKGGLVWHTQGSGKSLTMVMFVKALIEDPNIANPRVVIVTDRRDLDRQIRDTFQNCGLKKEVVQAKTSQQLIDLIKEKSLDVITTTVQKFEPASKRQTKFVDTDKSIFVLIDEAHRSQSGLASLAMNKIIPNACYIGFTGTPLMKSEKESWRKFGGYIDKYTIDDALEDKIILPLIYEGRNVELIQNEEQIDRQVERVVEGLDDESKKSIQKLVNTKLIKDNPQRIVEIAVDIERHYLDNFQGSGLKAQIVAPSKFSAVLFQKFFEEHEKLRTAVVISDEHDDGDEADTHKVDVVKYLDRIRVNHGSIGSYEKSVIDSFKHNEDGIEVIIVVDKLLTGFDAPRNTVLYLAKDLQDHNLLQAIARVNRLYENETGKIPKTAGYIVDYSENAKSIEVAMALFGNYDEADVKNTLIDFRQKFDELHEHYAALTDIFKEIKGSKDDEVFLQYLEDDARRDIFNKSLSTLVRSLTEAFVLQDAVHAIPEIDRYVRDLKKFVELKKMAALKFAEKMDLTEYKQSLIKILDKYIDARGVELLTIPIDITNREQFREAIKELGSDKSKAEAIAAQMNRTITEKMEEDPSFYQRFSVKVSEILEKMRAGKLADIEALKQLSLLSDEVIEKRNDGLPESIQSVSGAGIFYGNLKEYFKGNEVSEEMYQDIVLDIVDIVKQYAVVDWNNNAEAKRRILNAVDDYLYDSVKKELKIDLAEADLRAILGKTMILAENNYETFKAI